MTVKCKFTQSLLHPLTLLHQLAILLLFLLWTGLAIQPLYAHAEYDHSEPAADAVVESAPTQVRVWFTQELFRRKGENSIEVYQADGTRVDLDDLAISDDDRTLMTVSLKPAVPAGLYTVRWDLDLSGPHGDDGLRSHLHLATEVRVPAPQWRPAELIDLLVYRLGRP